MAEDSIFHRIETALDGDREDVEIELTPLRGALEELVKSGDPKAKAAARRARLAVDRASALFDELFELREKMRETAATPSEPPR